MNTSININTLNLLNHIKEINFTQAGCNLESKGSMPHIAHHEGEIKLDFDSKEYSIKFDLKNSLELNEDLSLKGRGPNIIDLLDLRTIASLPFTSRNFTEALNLALTPSNADFWSTDAKFAHIRPVFITKSGARRYVTFSESSAKSPISTNVKVFEVKKKQDLNETLDSESLDHNENISTSDSKESSAVKQEENATASSEEQQVQTTPPSSSEIKDQASEYKLDRAYISSLHNIDDRSFRNLAKKQLEQVKSDKQELERFLNCWANNPRLDIENALMLYSQDPDAVDVMPASDLSALYGLEPRDEDEGFINIRVFKNHTEHFYRLADCIDQNDSLTKEQITNRILLENRRLNLENLSLLRMPLSRDSAVDEIRKNTVFSFVNEQLHTAEIDEILGNSPALNDARIQDTGELLVDLLYKNLFDEQHDKTEISDQVVKNISINSLKDLHPLLENSINNIHKRLARSLEKEIDNAYRQQDRRFKPREVRTSAEDQRTGLESSIERSTNSSGLHGSTVHKGGRVDRSSSNRFVGEHGVSSVYSGRSGELAASLRNVDEIESGHDQGQVFPHSGLSSDSGLSQHEDANTQSRGIAENALRATGNAQTNGVSGDDINGDSSRLYRGEDPTDSLSQSKGESVSDDGYLSRGGVSTGEREHGDGTGRDFGRFSASTVHNRRADGRGLSDHNANDHEDTNSALMGNSYATNSSTETTGRNEGASATKSQAYATGNETDVRGTNEVRQSPSREIRVGDGQTRPSDGGSEEEGISRELGGEIRRKSTEDLASGSSMGSTGDQTVAGISQGQGRGGESSEGIRGETRSNGEGVSRTESTSGIARSSLLNLSQSELCDLLGISGEKLKHCIDINSATRDPAELNQFGSFDQVHDSADPAKVKAYFDEKFGEELQPFKRNMYFDSSLREYILAEITKLNATKTNEDQAEHENINENSELQSSSLDLSGDTLASANNSNEQIIRRGENISLPDDFMVNPNLPFNYAEVSQSNHLKVRLKDNVAAIELLKNHSSNADPSFYSDEDRTSLAKYSGWGGLPNSEVQYSLENGSLSTILTASEQADIKASTLNAFYTPTQVIDLMYDKVRELGFTGGQILEPSCGTGKFIGRIPEELKADSHFTGVELDAKSAEIASILYPQSKILHRGFEKTGSENYYDLAIGNVPFGNYQVVDQNDPEISGKSIHNYFFLKALKQVKPNGVVAFITSSSTLDSKGSSVRELMARKAKFLGAVRLPDNVFGSAGTSVTTDIIFLQKRERELDLEEVDLTKPEFSYVKTEVVDLPKDEIDNDSLEAININSYFVDHPEMVAGDLRWTTSQYGPKLCVKNGNFLTQTCLDRIKTALSNVKKDELTFVKTDVLAKEESNDFLNDPYFERAPAYSIYLDSNGVIQKKQNSHSKPVPFEFKGTKKAIKEKQEQALALVEIRDLYQRIRLGELHNEDEEVLRVMRTELSSAYDAYYAKYHEATDQLLRKKKIDGLGISAKDDRELMIKEADIPNHFAILVKNAEDLGLLDEDPSFTVLGNLERTKGNGEYIGKGIVFTRRELRGEEKVNVETPQDALILSIAKKGRVDIQYITSLLKSNDPAAVIAQLGKLVYRDPEQIKYDNAHNIVPFSGYVTADEYLSGNIYRKIDVLEKVIQTPGGESLRDQLDDLKMKIPTPLRAEDISAPLGSHWIPVHFYNEFLNELLDFRTGGEFIFDKKASSYEFVSKYERRQKHRFSSSYGVKATDTYGTDRMNATEIVHHLLNGTPISIKSTEPTSYQTDKKGNSIPVYGEDAIATEAALDKAKLIKQKFEEWIYKDEARATYLVDLYNRKYNAIQPREYNGELFKFEGMATDITLKPHQKNAIARTLLGGNTLLAHEVGAGKTFEMCASAMMKKNLGLAHKSCIVTPASVTPQFASEFYRLYPNAKLLIATKSNTDSSDKKKKFFAQAAYGDYDAVIMGQDLFRKIPMSFEFRRSYLNTEIEHLTNELSRVKAQNGPRFTIKNIELNKKRLETKLQNLNKEKESPNMSAIPFEQMAFDALYVDEAHDYKKVEVFSNNPLAQSNGSSERSADLMMKCQYLNKLYNNKAVTFATGTPISNSLVELYSMQKYLNQPALEDAEIYSVDDFLADFTSTQTKTEIGVDGIYSQKTRISEFRNIPEAMKIFGECADIKTFNDMKDYMDLPKEHTLVFKSESSPYQKSVMQEFMSRGLAIHSGNRADNMLKITSEGRDLALDGRCRDASVEDDPNSKINQCVANVLHTLKENPDCTQIIFCDRSTPNSGKEFNVYDDIKEKLIAGGLKEQEVAFIHDAKNDKEKLSIYNGMQSGRIKVLLGSTIKLGTGVNVQKKLKAVHHLDVAWRPSDMQQRNGRIIRQGNENKDVNVCYYVTSGSFDEFMFQTLQRKDFFIKQIMSNNGLIRKAEMSDDEEPEISFSELQAIACNDPLQKKRLDLQGKLQSLDLLRHGYLNKIADRKNKLEILLPNRLNSLTKEVNAYKNDFELYQQHANEVDVQKNFTMQIDGEVEVDPKKAIKKLVAISSSLKGDENVKCGTYAGFELYLRKDDVMDMLSNELLFSNTQVVLKGKSENQYVITLGEDGARNFTRINKMLSDLQNSQQNRATQLKEVIKETQELQEINAEDHGWEKQKEYDALKKQYDDVVEKIRIRDEQGLKAQEDTTEISDLDFEKLPDMYDDALDSLYDVNGTLVPNSKEAKQDYMDMKVAVKQVQALSDSLKKSYEQKAQEQDEQENSNDDQEELTIEISPSMHI